MIVYRRQERIEDTRAVLDRLCRTTDLTDLAAGFGELASGVADALYPQRDGTGATERVLRHASVEIGRALVSNEPWRARRAIGAAAGLPLPDRIAVSVPEGYAYYALYPQSYAEAARRFFRGENPRAATVIGIRSIGDSLSGVVAGTLLALGCDVETCTVRPRGHPFDRVIAAAPELEALLRARAGSWFLIVDEGPGLSGSSFASVSAWLSSLGVPDRRIALFPSWEPDGSAFVCPAAAERWRRHRKWTVPFEAVWNPPWPGLVELSAGKWREVLLEGEGLYPAVNPQHERRKYLRPGREPLLVKFEGLGERGRASMNLALQLAEAGFAPAVEGLRDGFLATRFEPGRPLSASAVSAALIERIAEYLAFRKRSFPAPPGASFDELLEMIRVNTAEAPGWDGLERYRAAVTDAGAVAIDGRMQPHEWLASSRGYVKTDALDHHDDHFLPGCQDIAWDLAGCAVEFGLTADAESHLLASYTRLSGDRALEQRLPFYRYAYAALRLGYAEMSARGLDDSAEGPRFQRLAARYRTRLAALRVR